MEKPKKNKKGTNTRHTCSPVEQFSRAERSAITRENSREQSIKITSQAQQILQIIFRICISIPIPTVNPIPSPQTVASSQAKVAVMAITKEVIPQWRRMEQCLQHRVHKTSTSQIIQTSQSPWNLQTRIRLRIC